MISAIEKGQYRAFGYPLKKQIIMVGLEYNMTL